MIKDSEKNEFFVLDNGSKVSLSQLDEAINDYNKACDQNNNGNIYVKRLRPSITQGSAVVYINDVDIITFGDDIRINDSGEWESAYSDAHFIASLLYRYEYFSDRLTENNIKAIEDVKSVINNMLSLNQIIDLFDVNDLKNNQLDDLKSELRKQSKIGKDKFVSYDYNGITYTIPESLKFDIYKEQKIDMQVEFLKNLAENNNEYSFINKLSENDLRLFASESKDLEDDLCVNNELPMSAVDDVAIKYRKLVNNKKNDGK